MEHLLVLLACFLDIVEKALFCDCFLSVLRAFGGKNITFLCKPLRPSSRNRPFLTTTHPSVDLPALPQRPQTFLPPRSQLCPACPTTPMLSPWPPRLPPPESCPTSPCSRTPSPD